MPRYRVTITSVEVIEVDATTPDEAEEKAADESCDDRTSFQYAVEEIK